MKNENKYDGNIWLEKNKLKEGDTIWTILRHVARSGMTRWIDAVVIREGLPVKVLPLLPEDIKKIFNWDNQRQGFKLSGCGMDMGFHLVYSISNRLFNDGYALKQRWL